MRGQLFFCLYVTIASDMEQANSLLGEDPTDQ